MWAIEVKHEIPDALLVRPQQPASPARASVIDPSRPTGTGVPVTPAIARPGHDPGAHADRAPRIPSNWIQLISFLASDSGSYSSIPSSVAISAADAASRTSVSLTW